MRKSRYSDEQIAAALRQAENGTSVAEITRKLGISEATFYVWNKRFGSLGTPEIRELQTTARGERDDPVLCGRIKEIAWNRSRYGYKRITVLLRREEWFVNTKRVRRIYREENLMIRTPSPKCRRAAVVREERAVPTASNQRWAMDFMHDVLADGTKTSPCCRARSTASNSLR